MQERVHEEWRPFGREVRRLRIQHGISQAQLGARISLSAAMVGALERATRIPKRDHLDALERVFATDGALLRLWEELLNHRRVPDWFRDALLMERRSHQIREYQPILIPGILQTADYARILIKTWNIRATPEEVDQLVQSRIARLPEIRPNRPSLWFVVDEVAISRVVGSGKIMRAQLNYIIEQAEEEAIRFQVLPTVAVHPGLCPPYRVMTLNGQRSAVYVEHALGGEIIDASEKVAQMESLFGAMQAEALAPTKSVDFLQAVQKEMTG